MKSFLLRHQWAIVLAVVQRSIFVTVGVAEHRRNLGYNREQARYEYFGCALLPHQNLPAETRWDFARCFLSVDLRFLILSNFPVFLIWDRVGELSEHRIADQY
jgi:hypothetical protein